MIDRILEPEVMDSAAEAIDYDSMDHSAVNRIFVADFLAVWNRRSPILDLGTGTAQIPIEFCRQSPEGGIIAVDLAEHMLALGRENVKRAGFVERIQLVKVNARGLSYPDRSFAAVMSNSIVHHIPEPRAVFAEINRVAVSGATIFVRDLLRPESEASLIDLVQKHAGGANDHQQRMFAESLHAALTLAEVQALVKEFDYPPEGVRQTTDRHWTWIAHQP